MTNRVFASLKFYWLELTVFVCGAIVMVFELIGSRILAPYLGTSIDIWTGLIGIILGSLALGYWLGGKAADKSATYSLLGNVIIISAALLLIDRIFYAPLLEMFSGASMNFQVKSFVVSLILFAPASMFLGMVSPIAVKLKSTGSKTLGRTVGNLYAISTFGSIIGTFAAGYWLIPSFGTAKITAGLIICLAIVGVSTLAISQQLRLGRRAALLAILLPLGLAINTTGHMNVIDDVDSKYNRIIVARGVDRATASPILTISTDPFGSQSGMLVGSDALVFRYTKYYDLAKHFTPSINRALMIGGSGYSYPKHFIKNNPGATMDVIEIDPKMTELAKKYFRLGDNDRMAIYHEDGRVYLNQNKRRYDAIFIDAFNSITVPYHLTTQQAVKLQYDSLNPGGTAMYNVISALVGEKSEFLQAEVKTLKSIFDQVFVFQVNEFVPAEEPQNIILVAIKTDQSLVLSSADPVINSYLDTLWTKPITQNTPVLTDDYAPVDGYTRDLYQ